MFAWLYFFKKIGESAGVVARAGLTVRQTWQSALIGPMKKMGPTKIKN